MELTSGAVALISERKSEGLEPTVQILDVRPVSTVQNSASERFRMLISDGVHTQQAMLATQMNCLVKEGSLKHGSVVKLHEFICNDIQNRKIVILIGLNILQTDCEVIGNAKAYDTAGGSPNLGTSPTVPTGLSITPKSTPPLNNPPYNSNHNPYIRNPNPNPRPNLPNPFPTNPNSPNLNPPNPNFQSRPPFNNNFNNRSVPVPAQNPSYQSPNYINRGPIMKNEGPVRTVPISSLNPYQGRWTIKARVTLKGELRSWTNSRGEGKVFSFDLLDSEGGEIRATCFNNAAEQFYNLIEFGKVYLISKGMLKPARKEFNPLNNEYEMNLDQNSMVDPCFEEDNSIPQINFNFKQISEIESLETNTMVDVIGVVTSISPSTVITKKNGTETLKRTLQIRDMSGKSVEITFWGNFVNNEGTEMQNMLDSGSFPILAVKMGRINEFNGKSISTIHGSQLFINPNFIPQANMIKDWYETEGNKLPSIPLSIPREMGTNRGENRKTVSQIKDEGLGKDNKTDWINVKAVITFIKGDSFCYTACPLIRGDRTCSKKVTNNGDGSWRCDTCLQNFAECDYRYILQFQISDHTGVIYVTAFQEAGEEIMGISAKDLYLIKFEEQDEVKYSEIIKNAIFSQYNFKLKVKEETYQDETRVKCSVMKADRVDPINESKYLLGLIDKISSEDQSANMNFNSNAGGNVNNAPINQMVNCGSCGGNGHNAQNCPYMNNNNSNNNIINNRQGGGMSGGGFTNRPLNNSNNNITNNAGTGDGSMCFRCKESGHWARDCPTLTAGSTAGGTGGGTGGNLCFTCQKPGHFARDCPSGGGNYAAGRVAGQFGGSKQYVGGY
ncbi:hypothetical protein LUZ60_003839 [Juncus effusus]|nr:hypothetical protein LUZ60_003839 [Juncus effusus]